LNWARYGSNLAPLSPAQEQRPNPAMEPLVPGAALWVG
jgi:hypothetical protein